MQQVKGVKLTQDPYVDCTKPSPKWLSMSDTDRRVCVLRCINMRTDHIGLLGIEKVNHIVVAIEGHDKRHWPTMLRELESLLKKEVEPSLQVYLLPRQDDSLLRLGRMGKGDDDG